MPRMKMRINFYITVNFDINTDRKFEIRFLGISINYSKLDGNASK